MRNKNTAITALTAISLLIHINIITSYAQPSYKIALAAFYNCENFYDTLDDESVRDEEFLPTGIRHYNTAVYQQKLTAIARVLADMGTDKSADGPALIGLAEIENKSVLQDLVRHPLLQSRHYGIIHYNSHDARGVDVALLYNPVYFKPDTSASLPVLIRGAAAYARLKQGDDAPADSTTQSYYYYSRDILWVKGRLDGEPVHVYVNHWPSRLGGETRTTPARQTAALICKRHWDSVSVRTPGVKALVMGDFNDDPVNISISKTLKATPVADTARPAGLYNPWTAHYRKGNGTLAYRDAWGLFDQIILSNGWLRQQAGFRLYGAYIYKPGFMLERQGRYSGYPMRFWEGTEVRGGFSDHFPVYIVLLKQAESAAR